MKRLFETLKIAISLAIVSWLSQIDISSAQLQCIDHGSGNIGYWHSRCRSVGGSLASVDLRVNTQVAQISSFLSSSRYQSCFIGLQYRPSGSTWSRHWLDGTVFAAFQIRNNVKWIIFFIFIQWGGVATLAG